ncbi:hypothetical protein ACINWC323_0327 [Acinetobacter sp. WC-323]|nr:hypothetical protein ACINWC323_0327 [Acinetobacter sp. WC-323]
MRYIERTHRQCEQSKNDTRWYHLLQIIHNKGLYVVLGLTFDDLMHKIKRLSQKAAI